MSLYYQSRVVLLPVTCLFITSHVSFYYQTCVCHVCDVYQDSGRVCDVYQDSGRVFDVYQDSDN